MDWIFAGIAVLIAFTALSNWRMAIYACVFLDVARDVVRKLTPEYPVLSTIIVGVVWAMALLGARSTEGKELRKIYSRYPRLRSAVTGAFAAILPGALVSLVRYENGWMLAVIGGISYLAPFIGVFLGYLWPRRGEDVYRWISLYVIVNALVLIGTLLEASHVNVPGSGGMKMAWIRNHGEDMVKLICGFYRSPDVMGLHAAHVMMFTTMLALRPGGRTKWLWWSIACWAASCLLLSGQRKMIVMPALFLATYVMLHWTSGKRGRRVAIVSVAFGVLVAAGLGLLTQLQDTSDEYSLFASSIVTEGVERAGKSFSSIVQVTIQQSGFLGDGLGSATQGKQHTGINIGKSWQEDGVGRLFKELGVPGVILIGFVVVFLGRSIVEAIRLLPESAVQTRHLQYGMVSVVTANAASFVISHQAYSGDPSTVLIVGFCLGMVFGMPHLWFGAVAGRDVLKPIENSHAY